MRDFRLRSDITRAVVNGFAYALGIDPGDTPPPTQGYTLAYSPGEEDDPDTYVFHVVVSHERLRAVVSRAFELLGEQVYGIVEIGSRDAYRSVDVYVGEEAVPRNQFVTVWSEFQTLLLEDSAIAAGANSEDPFVEIFLDHYKGLYIHVPPDTRDEVETMLQSFGLDEVAQTWPDSEEDSSAGEDADWVARTRPILDLQDEYSPDVDELLLQLRHEWNLELNVDPQANVDDGGRELGPTLWHAVIVVGDTGGDPEIGGYVSVWATASSLTEMEQLIQRALEDHPQWEYVETYTIDRVAFDERPDELADLPPRRTQSQIHLVQIDPWPEPPPDVFDSSTPPAPGAPGDSSSGEGP